MIATITSIIQTILILGIIAFLIYAMVAFYGAQPTNQSKARRALGAIIAAFMAMVALIFSWFQAPPPV